MSKLIDFVKQLAHRDVRRTWVEQKVLID